MTELIVDTAALSRRVARLQHELRRVLGSAKPDDKDIHALRVCIKKLRAWLQLVGSAQDDADVHEAALADLARALGPARDRAVLEHTMASLLDTPATPRQRTLTRHITAGLARRPRIPARLRQQLLQIRFTGFPATPPDKLRKQLLRSRDRARRSGSQSIYDPPRPHRLHRLRKRVKRLLYQIELLAPRESPALRKLEKGLRELARELGDAHDLTVLAGRLEAIDPALLEQACPDLPDRLALAMNRHATRAGALAHRHLRRKSLKGTSE